MRQCLLPYLTHINNKIVSVFSVNTPKAETISLQKNDTPSLIYSSASKISNSLPPKGKSKIFLLPFSSHPCTPYRCVGHDLSPKMTRSTCIHHKPYCNVLYVSSLPYLLSFQGLCNCISMQDASSSKSSIRLGNLFSIITESRQSLA